MRVHKYSLTLALSNLLQATVGLIFYLSSWPLTFVFFFEPAARALYFSFLALFLLTALLGFLRPCLPETLVIVVGIINSLGQTGLGILLIIVDWRLGDVSINPFLTLLFVEVGLFLAYLGANLILLVYDGYHRNIRNYRENQAHEVQPLIEA